MASICNLAVEFNGLVSKNGEQKCLAFLLFRADFFLIGKELKVHGKLFQNIQTLLFPNPLIFFLPYHPTKKTFFLVLHLQITFTS